jgi:hypothetical protein
VLHEVLCLSLARLRCFEQPHRKPSRTNRATAPFAQAGTQPCRAFTVAFIRERSYQRTLSLRYSALPGFTGSEAPNYWVKRHAKFSREFFDVPKGGASQLIYWVKRHAKSST